MTDWWEYPTNYSGNEINGVADFFVKYPSAILNDTFAIGIIILIWISSFMLSLRGGSRKAILISSFISFIFSLYFIQLGVMNLIVPIILIVLTIIGAIGGDDGGYGI